MSNFGSLATAEPLRTASKNSDDEVVSFATVNGVKK